MKLMGKIMVFLMALALSLSSSASPWWPFGPKESPTLSMHLQGYTGRTALSGLTVVYEFSPQGDRVFLEAPNFPEINGREIFRGVLKAVALDEMAFDKIFRTIPEEAKQRIHFFPSYLRKRSYASRDTGGKTVKLQTQSFFMDSAKTYVLDYTPELGLNQLEINKVYGAVLEIEVAMSERLGGGARPTQHHPRFETSYYAVTVKPTVRPGSLAPNPNKGTSQNLQDQLQDSERKALQMLNVFANHLIENRQDKVHLAMENLLRGPLQRALTPEDQVNLRVIDEYLLRIRSVNPSRDRRITFDSHAHTVRDALSSRFIAYGGEIQDTWLFQFQPLMQNVTTDFIPKYSRGEWRTYSADPELLSTYLRSDRGLLVLQSSVSRTILEMAGPSSVRLNVYYSGWGHEERSALLISTELAEFETRREQQIRRGLQGVSEDSLTLLDELLLQRAHSTCLNFFSL